MNSAQLAQSAYSRSRPTIRTPRATEYDAFARITRQLRAAAELGPEGFPQLAAALHDNRRLWNVLAIDVAHAENRLPEALKARILSLAGFTHQHTSKVLRGQARPDILIEINTAIMAGLRAQGAPRPADPAPSAARAAAPKAAGPVSPALAGGSAG